MCFWFTGVVWLEGRLKGSFNLGIVGGRDLKYQNMEASFSTLYQESEKVEIEEGMQLED